MTPPSPPASPMADRNWAGRAFLALFPGAAGCLLGGCIPKSDCAHTIGREQQVQSREQPPTTRFSHRPESPTQQRSSDQLDPMTTPLRQRRQCEAIL